MTQNVTQNSAEGAPVDAREGLNRWLPLVKWFLALPHYLVLLFLGVGAAVAVVIAWFAILFTGRYPRGLFDYVVGVGRWALRVQACPSCSSPTPTLPSCFLRAEHRAGPSNRRARPSAAKRHRGRSEKEAGFNSVIAGDLMDLTAVSGAGPSQFQSSTTVITTLPTLRPLSTYRCAATISASGIAAVDDDPDLVACQQFPQLGQGRVLAHRHPGPDPRAAVTAVRSASTLFTRPVVGR